MVWGVTRRKLFRGNVLGRGRWVMGRAKVNVHGKVNKEDLEFQSKTTEARIIERRSKVMELLTKSWSYSQIAREVGVSPMQITRDVKEVTDEWREQYLLDMDRLKAKEVARAEYVLNQLWQEWEVSRWRTVQKVDKDGNPKGPERKVRVVADVEIMDRIIACVRELWKLYGFAQDVNLTQNNLNIGGGGTNANPAPIGSAANPFPWEALYGKPALPTTQEQLVELDGKQSRETPAAPNPVGEPHVGRADDS